MPKETFLNDHKFNHAGFWGTNFIADRCDFRGGVTVNVTRNIDRETFLQDVSEIIGYHATNVLPRLNGFQGYGTFPFSINGWENLKKT